jgi:16S rRNA G527 N7-methylase RsmG
LLSDETLRAVLVEPRRIRTAFLRTAAGSLDIAARMTALEAKIEPSNPVVAGAPFAVALSRATFSPAEWLPIGAQLAHEAWVLTAGAEPEPSNELRLVRRVDYAVPTSGAPRAISAYRSASTSGADAWPE